MVERRGAVAMATLPGRRQSRVAGACFRFPRFSFFLTLGAHFSRRPAGWGLHPARTPHFPHAPLTARVRDLIAPVRVWAREIRARLVRDRDYEYKSFVW